MHELTFEWDDLMKSEYDFSKMSGAVRGKYYKAYRAGHKVEIHKKNGQASVQYFKPEKGAVILEPDVLKYFPDALSVNATLRSLIHLIPLARRKEMKRTATLHHA